MILEVDDIASGLIWFLRSIGFQKAGWFGIAYQQAPVEGLKPVLWSTDCCDSYVLAQTKILMLISGEDRVKFTNGYKVVFRLRVPGS